MPNGLGNRRWCRALAAGAAVSASLAVANAPLSHRAHPLSAPAQPGQLQQAVTQAVLAAGIGDATVGIQIVDLSTGAVLAEHDNSDGRGFMPASNMKLITTGAALHVLGPKFRFKTDIRRDGDRIIIVGGGDPGFADPVLLSEMQPKSSVGEIVELLADFVVRSGMAHVSEIIIDDRIFDRNYVHPSWPKDQLNKSYCAEVNGLNFHLNVVNVFATPADELGIAPSIQLEPNTRELNLRIRVRTTGRQGTQAIWITRTPDTNNITIGGAVRIKASADVTIHDSATLFGHLLAACLARRGLADGPIVRLAEENERLPVGESIVPIVTPIARAVRRCNTDSKNLYAESMRKRLGAVSGEPGSWSNGATMVHMVVQERLGSSFGDELVVADGSGLSRLNRISPQLMTAWLGSLYLDPELGDIFVASLATPGQGTLRSRFTDRPENEVRAKTGYINGVRTMSGYVIDETHDRAVAFSVLLNGLNKSEEHQAAKRLQEKIVHIADAWLTRRAAVATERFGG